MFASLFNGRGDNLARGLDVSVGSIAETRRVIVGQ